MSAIFYPAKIKYIRSDKSYLVEFPDLPGCLTEGETVKNAIKNAEEALSGYLASIFERGFKIPKPSKLKGKNIHYIEPNIEITVPLMLRELRRVKSLNQTAVAEKLGITQQAYQRLENPQRCNATIKMLGRISEVFGKKIHLEFA